MGTDRRTLSYNRTLFSAPCYSLAFTQNETMSDVNRSSINSIPEKKKIQCRIIEAFKKSWLVKRPSSFSLFRAISLFLSV